MERESLEDVLIGDSAETVALRAAIDSAARTQAKVLILGETGAGKEVVARRIHRLGARRQAKFIAVNCSGVPETLLESELFGHTRGSFTGAFRDKAGLARVADGGTLFLDEVGEMSLRMQAIMLRFVETGEIQPIGAPAHGAVDVRLIAATNRGLMAQIEQREFREDLYYRLNVIQIKVPPLRDRTGDVDALLRYYIDVASKAHAIPAPDLTAAAREVLRAHRWPGNIRELKNVAERIVIAAAGRSVTVADLPAEIRPAQASVPAAAPASAAPFDPTSSGSVRVDVVWSNLMQGESFWATAHHKFKSHDLTRDDLRALIHRGLTQTRGNYRQLVRLFGMEEGDYRRFLSFLHQHNCNLPFQAHRLAGQSGRQATPRELEPRGAQSAVGQDD